VAKEVLIEIEVLNDNDKTHIGTMFFRVFPTLLSDFGFQFLLIIEDIV